MPYEMSIVFDYCMRAEKAEKSGEDDAIEKLLLMQQRHSVLNRPDLERP